MNYKPLSDFIYISRKSETEFTFNKYVDSLVASLIASRVVCSDEKMIFNDSF